jgi:gamma-glutamyltranspeptidase / glutathione hydrolase
MKRHYLIQVLLTVAALSVLTAAGCDRNDRHDSLSYRIPEQPESGTGFTPKPGWAFTDFAVAAANPLATDAGYQIIQAGGSAIDAAIAVQLVLSLVEPQSSGIGGGAIMLYWDGEDIHAYNGRETAPAGADETLFLDQSGRPLPRSQAVNSGLSVGVPGTLAVLKTVHQKYGKLPWRDLFVPAITLAGQGFRVSPRLHRLLQEDATLRDDDIARALYYDEAGNAHPVGHVLRNPAYAELLGNVVREGITAFYEGDAAESMANRVQNHSRPGTLSADDLHRYPSQDFSTDAMCTDWRNYRICGFPPPSSGHIAIMQMLGILELTGVRDIALAPGGLPGAEWLHYYMEAAKLAIADRDQFLADPDYVEAPAGDWYSLLDENYLAGRASLIGTMAMEGASPGDPGKTGQLFGIHPRQAEKGTSHISIVDRQGRAVSMTTTIEAGFGSRIMSDGGTGLPGGFLLNNELTDFSLTPADDQGLPVANRVEPGKRPRSSMSPSLVFDRESGRLIAAAGSPGGAALIHYTAKTLYGMLAWNLNAQEAIDLPNFVNYNGPALLESGYFPSETIRELEERGHVVFEREMPSGIQAIQRTAGGWFGGADPRREGVVMGE